MRKVSKDALGLLLVVALALIILSALQLSKPPSTIATANNESFVVHIPQKALFRNYVTVSVEATPGIRCDLTYFSPSGDITSTETTADKNGLCSWKWKIDETKGKGTGRLIFTIDGRSETHFIEVRASF